MEEGKQRPGRWERFVASGNLAYVILGLVGIILILVSPHLPSTWKGYQYWKPVVDGLAGSMIIATILIYTVELSSRRRQLKASARITNKISEDVFRAIYNRYVPDSIFREVEECLLMSNIYREDFCIDVKLSPLTREQCPTASLRNNAEKYYLLHSHTTYKLINTKDLNITHKIKTLVELPLNQDLFDLVKITGVRIGGEAISPEIIDSGTAVKTDRSALVFELPVNLNARGEVDVSVSYQAVKQKVDMEVWSTREPTYRLKLKVSAPEGLEVQAKANHSKDVACIRDGLPGCFEWNLPFGIFPHQSVVFWWH